MNRLANALSPYLRQHAENPVDWYPWGDEAIAKARAEDKPILLSIGYSACHWCHVMEHESFSDAETAARMNAQFVSVKVDREERPELDQIYQLALQLMQRRAGGWPLTMFLAPDTLTPFFGGTYFPPTPRYGMPSFTMVLEHVAQVYADRRSDVAEVGRELTAALERATAAQGGALPDAPLEVAVTGLAARFDRTHGGFGTEPKFPSPMALELLLVAGGEGREHALFTLDAMRRGGIWDHIGGGFHRYSTDARWHVPHFEKMLYDNAQLARLYAMAARLAPDAGHDDTLRAILTWSEREMRRDDGLFYATQDADSEGEEGTFFVWTAAELEALLDDDERAVVFRRFGITLEGSWEHGKNVLYAAATAENVAEALGQPVERVESLLASALSRMNARRETRERPFRDEKIVAAWNGLMISAFAEASMVVDDPGWAEVAREGLAAIRRVLWHDGTLRRIAKDDVSHIPGFLEDHALVALAALDVYEATFDQEALDFATELLRASDRFWDGERYFQSEARDDLFVRPGGATETATPSGISAICIALLRRHALGGAGTEGMESRAETVLRAWGAEATRHAFGHAHLVLALHRWQRGPTEVTFVGTREPSPELLAEARRAFLPRRALRWLRPEQASDRPGEGVVYLCEQRTCSPPMEEASALLRALAELP